MRAPVVAGRTRHDDSPGRELAAGLATAAVVAQLLFAQATLVVAGVLIAIGRASRWRPPWLLLPALAGLGWLLAHGATLPAIAAFSAALPRRLAVPVAHQLPSALLLGSAEAALVLWLVWYPLAWRPGLVAVLRREATARALSTGHRVAAGGFALGLVNGTGRPVILTWAEAECGVLITGPDEVRLGDLGLAAACAAMRLRKPVLIADLNGAAAATVGLARSLGIPVTSGPDCSRTAELGLAIRRRSVAVASPRGARAVADLILVLESLHEHQLWADCLAYISGSEQLERGCLDRLLELAPATGTALLLTSSSEAFAAAMAARAQVVVADGAMTGNVATQLASQVTKEGRERAVATQRTTVLPRRRVNPMPVIVANLAAQSSSEFTVLSRRAPWAGASRPCVLPHCRLVPVDVKP